MNPGAGGRNYRFATYDSHSPLHEAIRLVRGPRRPSHSYFLRAESFCNAATRAEDFHARYGGRSLHHQSHGESFLHLIQGDFRPGGLYLPDEPEAALSPQRQLPLLYELSRAGAQFILATHSPILTGLPGAALLSMDGGAMRPIAYADTEGGRVTEMFINRREALLRQLPED